jgi:hypothetical protein
MSSAGEDAAAVSKQRAIAAMVREIGDLDQKLASARADGRRLDVALLTARRNELWDNWIEEQLEALGDEVEQIKQVADRAAKCLAVWKERSEGFDKDFTEPTPAQMAILAPASLLPKSWSEANAAIHLLPEFRMPDHLSMSAAIQQAERVLEAARMLLPEAEAYLAEMRAASSYPTEWNAFCAKDHSAYFDARAALDEATGALDGTS